MLRPSGDHSYPKTPSGAFVSCRAVASAVGATANTCGPLWVAPVSAIDDESGDQRSCGRGVGVLKIVTLRARCAARPPPADTTHKSPWCSLRSSIGVDTT